MSTLYQVSEKEFINPQHVAAVQVKNIGAGFVAIFLVNNSAVVSEPQKTREDIIDFLSEIFDVNVYFGLEKHQDVTPYIGEKFPCETQRKPLIL